MMLPTAPKPWPFTICPARKPATAPMSTAINNPTMFMRYLLCLNFERPSTAAATDWHAAGALKRPRHSLAARRNSEKRGSGLFFSPATQKGTAVKHFSWHESWSYKHEALASESLVMRSGPTRWRLRACICERKCFTPLAKGSMAQPEKEPRPPFLGHLSDETVQLRSRRRSTT